MRKVKRVCLALEFHKELWETVNRRKARPIIKKMFVHKANKIPAITFIGKNVTIKKLRSVGDHVVLSVAGRCEMDFDKYFRGGRA